MLMMMMAMIMMMTMMMLVMLMAWVITVDDIGDVAYDDDEACHRDVIIPIWL